MLQKKKLSVITALIILCLVIFSACGSPVPEEERETFESGLTVNFIDVGQGDSIFIRLPDGKNILIDCGYNDEKIKENIFAFFSDYGVEKLDYLILTHPDNDHIGNAKSIIENYEIGRLYHPYIIENLLGLFLEYKQAYNLALEKSIECCVSDCYDFIKGEDYFLSFLSPMPSSFKDGIYAELNKLAEPTDALINNLSPIIYLEYKDVSFLFTGDAEFSQEQLALENVNSYLFKSNLKFYGIEFNLDRIDYLKVAHHGSKDSTGSEFLSRLNPSNAIISVGGDNVYGHPSSQVIERIIKANPDCNLYRTDVCGNICVNVNEEGAVTLFKQSQ